MRSSNFFQSIAVACLGSTNTRSWPSLSKNLGFLVTIVRVVFFQRISVPIQRYNYNVAQEFY